MTWFRVLLVDDRPEKVGAWDSNTKGRGPGRGLMPSEEQKRPPKEQKRPTKEQKRPTKGQERPPKW